MPSVECAIFLSLTVASTLPKWLLNSKNLFPLVNVMVSDQGMGISEEEIGQIFNRFYRIDKSRSTESGYGLGLSIAQEIIKIHNGTISVKSSKKGSVFTVELPV